MQRLHMCATVAGLAIAAGLAAPAAAQVFWDRQAEQIAIVSLPTDPPGTYRITGAWSVEASGISSLPLNTSVSLSRNGTTIFSTTVNIIGLAGGSGCELCPAPNVCLCAEPSGPCSCNALWLTTEVPGPVALQSGDVLKLLVGMGAGGEPELDQNNDTTSLTFGGTPSFWNRRLVSAQLTPSPCPGSPDLFDLSVGVAFDFSAMSGEVDLGTKVILLMDDVVAYEFNLCDDNPWLTSGVGCIAGGNCGVVDCGSGSCAGSPIDLDCEFVELLGGAYMSCVCSSGELAFQFPGLSLPNLSPQSTIKCMVVGLLASALPELTPFDDDNGLAIPAPTSSTPCSADLNGDGIVDGADLGIMLALWGPCPK